MPMLGWLSGASLCIQGWCLCFRGVLPSQLILFGNFLKDTWEGKPDLCPRPRTNPIRVRFEIKHHRSVRAGCLLKKMLYFYFCIHMCLCVDRAGGRRGQRVSTALHLQIQALLRSPSWVSGTELGSFARAPSALKDWAISPSPDWSV